MTVTLRNKLIIAALAISACAAGLIIYNHPESADARQRTDDARISADYTVIVPRVNGYITRVAVDDNQPVRAGDPLVTVDDRDFINAVGMAEGQVNAATAEVASLQGQLTRQASIVAQANADLRAAAANLKLAQANAQRFGNLARDGSGTVQARQQSATELLVSEARLSGEQAKLREAESQVAILQAGLKKAQAQLQVASAAKNNAALNLSWTHIVAPIDGVVAERHARPGGYARDGEALLVIVPLESLYIVANYRETQLAHVKVGQPVSIAVDALPGVRFRGVVESLAPASNVSFSAVAPHNATGNFTKIVQRLPVKIRLLPDQKQLAFLRVGMSVVTDITTEG